MMQPYQQSSQGSSDKSPSSHSMQLIQPVLKNVLMISQDERVSFSKCMGYNDTTVIMNYVMTSSSN